MKYVKVAMFVDRQERPSLIKSGTVVKEMSCFAAPAQLTRAPKRTKPNKIK